ncbi:MAG: hypothetical protein DMD52_10725 [Gemmatimonadetes bacterium]|nr:MAG: hypothetical protein DMD52_10725 [Gemmatimonadota bacterium]
MKRTLSAAARASSQTRGDKWYLGAGDGLIWAPPFPQWLDAPGFWDEAHLFQYVIRPLFTLTFLIDGSPVPVRCLRRRWTPAVLTLEHAVGSWRARETRSAPGGALASEWELRNPTAQVASVDIVVWTAVDGASLAATDVHAEEHVLRFTREVADQREHRARVAHRLTLDPAAQSFGAYRSEPSTAVLPPRFELTPFYDRWQASGRLRDQLHLEGIDPRGVMYLGLQRRLRLTPRGTVRFSASVALELEAARARAGADHPSGRSADQPPRRAPDRPRAVAERRWHEFLGAVPTFRCSDPYLDGHWRHRWYGLRLNAIAGGIGNYRYPTVCEGIGGFHVPITYSAQCHMRELRWLADPAWARGVLRTFLAHQNPDGSLPGRVYVDHQRGTDFYHADWGGALEALEAVHPDPAFEAEVYPALVRYAAWLLRTRDADHTGMIDVVNQFETGQEYMSRYQAVDPEADRVGWESRIRLKGVDVTVYAYRLLRSLERLADRVSPGDVGRWREAGSRTGRAIAEKMWDPAAGMFFDVNPRTARPTSVKAAVCFYPYGTDLADARHVAGLERHLFEPAEFWTAYPVPSSSVDDPLFNPDAEWKGKRHNCPWNGRVWPMTNSHIIDALARVVRLHQGSWAGKLGHLIHQFARMMTFDGDPERPNCFEHYHPHTGRPSVYRGIDDYLHSWVNDLIVSHVMGVLPDGPGGGLTVWPVPLGVSRAALDGVRVAGRGVAVAIDGARFRVKIDGRAAGEGNVGDPLTIAFG